MDANTVLDENLTIESSKTEAEILDTNKFLLLYCISFGLYGAWWMYKAWRFFKEKESLDILPAARAIFSIFFVYGLFNKIIVFARQHGYVGIYSTIGLSIAFIMLSFASALPPPYWFISFAACFCFLQPLDALNFAVEKSNLYRIKKANGFNNRQIAVIIGGIIFWILVLIGLFATPDRY